MIIKNLSLIGFRNLKNRNVDTSYKQVILKGENGQGKTNFLEAVYLVCYGSSFRTQNLKDLILHNEKTFRVSAKFQDIQGLDRDVEVFFDDSKKKIKLDNKEIRDRKDLIYSLPCIAFTHDDIEFVRGEPENRRRFFDQTMSMYDPVFFDDLRRYKLILRQRNAALKNQNFSLLDVYDEKLALYGIPIIKARKAVIDSFLTIFPDIYKAVSLEDKKISITYKPSWGDLLDVDSIISKLHLQRDVDLKMLTTTSGPHRDRFTVVDENGPFVSTASTGQMRLASLVFRSAQAAFYRQKTGINPIFLIDDVLLELDASKRARYLAYLGHYNQAFFTFLPEEKYFGSFFDMNDGNTKVYNVKDGDFLDE